MELDERFARWQGQAISQLTFAINLFVGFSVGALAYVLAFLREPTFVPNDWYAKMFIGSLVLLLVAVALGIGAVVTRLLDFRTTAETVRLRQESAGSEKIAVASALANSLGKATWRLFWGLLATFSLGIICFTTSLVSVYGSRILGSAGL